MPSTPRDPLPTPARRAPIRHRLLATFGLLAVLTPAVVTTGIVAPQPAEATTSTPVMQRERLTADQMASWFRANEPRSTSYQASIPVRDLAALYLEEGRAEGVAGDLAFAQSVLETGWFRWPSHGQVTPTHNNYSGIGACDGGTCTVARFRSERIGVRAQIQHLRAYADPTVTVARLANPLESPRFHLVTPKGKAPTWERMGGGNWATDPAYATKILRMYASMLAHAQTTSPAPTAELVVAQPRFRDVPFDSAHNSGVELAARRGIVTGCTTTRFCPTEPVTRGQAATMLVRALDLPTPAATTSRFTDATGPHAPAIAALTAAGITRGCTPTRFCRDDVLTRAQFAALLVRALELPAAPARFPDVRGHTHAGAIGAATRAGIIGGHADGRFRPDVPVTRAQAATLLVRAVA